MVAGVAEHDGKLRAGWVVKTDVRDDASTEESGNAKACSIIKLVGNQKIQGLKVFLQRTDSAHGNNALDTEHLHGANVGAIINFGGKDAVTASVAGEKGNAMAFEIANHERVRGIAKWSAQADFARALQGQALS